MSDADLLEQIVQEIDARLRAAGSPERADQQRAYLKSSLEFYGVAVPVLRREVLAVLAAHPGLDHDDVVALAAALWDAPVHDRRAAAVEVITARVRDLGPDDVGLLERLLRESGTWALSDNLSASVVGDVVARHPDELGPVLDRWSTDDDFWLRRASMLALLVPLRRGGGDFPRFARYADAMIEEQEFFIRKAIGWVLRDTSRRRPELVFEWALPRAARMSGVTFREVVKHLSPEQRAALEAAR